MSLYNFELVDFCLSSIELIGSTYAMSQPPKIIYLFMVPLCNHDVANSWWILRWRREVNIRLRKGKLDRHHV